MLHSDFLAYPFSQMDLLNKPKQLTFDQRMDVDFFHCTAAPPFVRTMDELEKEVRWFVAQMEQCLFNEDGGEDTLSRENGSFHGQSHAVYGLQNLPDDFNIHQAKDLGISIVPLAYEMENAFGGGFATPNSHITEKGRQLIREAGELGLIVDLSHAGHRTAREALVVAAMVGTKVCISHAGCYAVYNHPRNLPDDIIRGVSELGGMVGILTLPFMLDATDNSIEPFFRHLEHAINLLDDDAVCVGTDDVYVFRTPEQDRKLHETLKEKLDPRGNFRLRYPDRVPELNTPEKFAFLREQMLRRGYGRETIKGVLGLNLSRWLRF